MGFLVFVSGVAALNMCYVVPDRKSCNEKPSPCFTLTKYAQNASDFFTDNTEMIFLPGTHYLNTNLSIMNVQNISLTGMSGEVVIECSQKSPVSITIKWSSSITFQNLNLKGCGRNGIKDSAISPNNNDFVSFEKCTLGVKDFNRTYTAIFFENVRDIFFSYLKVSDTSGFGVYLYNCWGEIKIEHSQFSRNRGNMSYNGGNFYVVLWKNCTVDNKSADVTISSSHFKHGLSNSQYHSHKGIDASGLHMCSFCPTASIRMYESHFSHNKGGNIYIFMLNYIEHYWNVRIENSKINKGRAYEGAGAYFASRLHREDYKRCNRIVRYKNYWLIKNTNFTDNNASYSGGAVKIQLTESDCKPAIIKFSLCRFAGNSISSNYSIGAALRVMKHEVPIFRLVRVAKHEVILDQVNFSEHYLINKTYASVVKVENFGKLTFKDSNFANNVGTALSLKGSLVIFEGNNTFFHNKALNGSGGAINLCESSSFFINRNTTITFDSNHASGTGGAIYIQESCTGQYEACFFQPNINSLILIENLRNVSNMNLHFVNNTADVAGSAIYGGSIERCHTYYIFSKDSTQKGFNFSLDIIKTIFHFDSQSSALSEHISSDAYKVQFCNSTVGAKSLSMHVIPGMKFTVLVKTVGQVDGPSPGAISVDLVNQTNEHAAVIPVGYFKPTSKCSNLTLMVSHTRPGRQYSVRLKVQQNRPEFMYSPSMYAYINIQIDKCPWGFHFDNNTGQCECISLGKGHSIQCFLDDMFIVKHVTQYIWIGCDSSTESCTGKGLLYGICGQASYCNDESKVSVNTTRKQCTLGRGGLACGTCLPNNSLQLGSSQCRLCTNLYLGLLLLFAVAPFVLLVLISVLNITVSNGSIYGFLFYASFIQPLYALLLRHNTIHNRRYIVLMYSIISWFNLDIGIKTCFYNGMTAYQKIWLEFIFIGYVWALEILIIRLCRQYVYFTRLCGANIGKVLSTVLYMTVIKCTKLTFQCLHYIAIHDTSHKNYTYFVWSPQTSIRYLSGYHIPLFIFAVIMLAILLMFVSSLLFIQFLRRQSFLSIVRRFLPFFETFSGPCNDTHAFWPGMIVFLQVGFHFQIMTHIYSDKSVVLAISTASFLIIVLSFLGHVECTKSGN